MHDQSARLERFVTAQKRVMPTVLDELQRGAKRSHWMWFVFPQIAGLGLSETARLYAIADLKEARAYLAHATLGERLRRCTKLVNLVTERTPHAIFGSPDDMKFRSSMTLFAAALLNDECFGQALDKYYEGKPDQATLNILAGQAAG